MTQFERIDGAILKDGPIVLLWLAAILMATPVLLLPVSFFGEIRIWATFQKVVAVTALPASLTFAMLYALRHRLITTFPLTYVLCDKSLQTVQPLQGHPDD